MIFTNGTASIAVSFEQFSRSDITLGTSGPGQHCWWRNQDTERGHELPKVLKVVSRTARNSVQEATGSQGEDVGKVNTANKN